MEDKVWETLNMTEEEFEQKMDKFVDEMVKVEEKKVKSMYEQRHTFLPKLVNHMKEKGTIDDEDMLYFPEKYAFTSDGFHAFFDIATRYIDEEHGVAEDEDCIFENKIYFLRCKDVLLEFFIMWGQGTATKLKIVEEESMIEIPEKYIASFDGWVRYIEEVHQNMSEPVKKEKQGE